MKHKMYYLFALLIIGLLASCGSMFGKFEDLEMDGVTLNGTYRAEYKGAENFTNFFLSAVFDAVHDHDDAEEFRVDIYIMLKDGTELSYGYYTFDDLKEIRSYDSKTVFRSKSRLIKKAIQERVATLKEMNK